MANDKRNHGTPGKAARVDRVPHHGAPNEYGETERYGGDNREPVHQPSDIDDDREPHI